MQDVGVNGATRKVLSEQQISDFERDGFLTIEKFLSQDWMTRLTETTARFVEESRHVPESNEKFDLEPDHTYENPRLRRLQKPQDQDPVYYDVAFNSPIVDLVEDLLGPDLKFHHGKLNFKWSGGGAEIKWHQDIPFWPHTAYNVATVGIALDDIDDSVGPMGVIGGSHKGPVYDHYGTDGTWRGYIGDSDAKAIDIADATYLKGAAGTITIHHCRSVHGSMPNNHPTRARPFLLFAYSAANCLPLMPYNQDSKYNGAIVRGRHPDFPVFEGEPCKLPPLRSKSSKYRSIFASQKAEDIER
ncbi:MAG: phytanoyl-CoA dioxygenase family protein [Pseudomonadota bacterium]